MPKLTADKKRYTAHPEKHQVEIELEAFIEIVGWLLKSTESIETFEQKAGPGIIVMRTTKIAFMESGNGRSVSTQGQADTDSFLFGLERSLPKIKAMQALLAQHKSISKLDAAAEALGEKVGKQVGETAAEHLDFWGKVFKK